MLDKPPKNAGYLFRNLSCEGCLLEYKGAGFSQPDGSGRNNVLLVGEALGKTESYTGKPFVGAAGYQLNRTLKRTQLNRDDFKIWNIIACRPPNNRLVGTPWHDGAIDQCRQYLERVILDMKPKVIVPMGGVALKSILGISGIMDRRAPKRGYVYDLEIFGHSCLALPTMHPSYVLQGNAPLTWVQLHDLNKAVHLASNGEEPYHPEYLMHPSRSDVNLFVTKAGEAVGDDTWLTADIETARHTHEIERISFAYKAGHAITLPWKDEHLDNIQKLFQLSFPFLVFWNAPFDVPRLKDAGMVLKPKIYDAMQSWHFLQSDLPKALGFVSTFFTPLREWKSISDKEPERYSCIDSDAAITNCYGTRKKLIEEGRHDDFLRRQGLQVALNKMSASGILVDLTAKKRFKDRLGTENEALQAALQSHVPNEIKPVEERRVIKQKITCWRCRGVGKAIDVKSMKVTFKWLKENPDEERDWIYGIDPCVLCDGQKTITKNLPPSEGLALNGYTAVETSAGWRWQKTKPFLTNSKDQVLKYIQHNNHRVAKNKGKDTTEEKALRGLIRRYKKDPVYPLILKIRKVDKLVNTYLGPTYTPDEDSRLRTMYTQNPANGRLSSRNPNLQNLPNPKRAGADQMKNLLEFRRMFVASPGHKLVAIDKKGFEAVITGWFAKDDDYIRWASLGVHAILAWIVLHDQGKWDIPFDPAMPDGDIKATASEIKSKFGPTYDDCKHVTHLSNYGGTVFRIKHEYPESFPTMKKAQYIQDLYFQTIGKKIRQWQQSVLLEAHQKLYLETPWGWRRYFWDVYTSDGKWGSSAKDALAFLPASAACDIILDDIARVSEMPLMEEALRLQIHDELLYELPDDKYLNSRVRLLKKTMEHPVPQLDDLKIECEVSIGSDWGRMEDWK